MQFFIRKRPRPVVPIISLIDILAILLIFFVATSTFRRKKAAMVVNLPKAGALANTLEGAERIPLVMKSATELVLGDHPVGLDGLADELAALRAENPGARLELQADEQLPVGTLVAVWDALTRAGFSIKEIPTRLQMPSKEAPATP